MSGVCGADRILREDVTDVVLRFAKIIEQFPEYYTYVSTGSFCVDKTKEDFGDIDLVVTFNTDKDKKELKKELVKFFESFDDNIILPFKSDKYKGKRTYNSGEIITIMMAQEDPTKSAQIDVIVSLSPEETLFKKNFLDMPAEKQGLILGMTKVAVMEDSLLKYNTIESLRRPDMTLDLEDNEIVEFNLSSKELQLRAIVYDDEFKEISRRTIWSNSSWQYVEFVLKDKLSMNFDELLSIIDMNYSDRSKRRIVGVFKSMVSVKTGEVNTIKGLKKENAISRVKMLLKE